MSWSARICREAVGYARIGWPVAPGACAIGRPRRWQWLINPDARTPTPACSCGDRDCPAPAAHPIDQNPQPLTDPDAVRAVWAAPDPPNIMLSCGTGFNVIEVGGQVAAETEKILAAWRLNPAIALTATPVVQRLLFVAPGPPVPLPAAARYLGAGNWVPAPPSSRGPAGEDRWFWPYDTRWRQLPPAGEVAEAVTLADQQVRRVHDGAISI
ncbi:bifunctional DNA primase/polymerase [Actinocatenispora comari]|uniref:DNA primase n=1 Tax=Actinocatenispora comari TaxID=2807577 RepID=A0A8J4EPT9_9ACTN|nr:bifunctional DNA primase/polymerase [Actinocatenispora comari]GIL32031.1 DNA primase [Actinocatenispora comari]